MDGVHGGVIQDPAVVRFRLLHAEFGGELVGLLDLRFTDRVQLYVAQPANPFQVNPPDEPGAEDCGFECSA